MVHLGSSCFPLCKACASHRGSDVLICGALHAYKGKRKRSLSILAQYKSALSTANMGGGTLEDGGEQVGGQAEAPSGSSATRRPPAERFPSAVAEWQCDISCYHDCGDKNISGE